MDPNGYLRSSTRSNVWDVYDIVREREREREPVFYNMYLVGSITKKNKINLFILFIVFIVFAWVWE